MTKVFKVTDREEKALSNLLKNLDKVIYVESKGNYCRIFTSPTDALDETIRIALSKIKEFTGLVQIHRSYLVNPVQVTDIIRRDEHYSLLANDREIPVGQIYISIAKNILENEKQ